MWGLKYFLLCAWVTAVAWLPIEGEGIIDGWQPFQLVNGALRRRDTGDPKSFCRYWGHSSVLVHDKLYIAGGIATMKENFRAGIMYLIYVVIIADLGSDVQFPVELDNWVITGVSMGDSGESTVQGAFWWDGGDYIYRYGGWFGDNRTWTNTTHSWVRPSDMWRFNLSNFTWEQEPIDPPTIHRAWGGAVASVPEKKTGYFLGGIVDNRTDTAFANTPDYYLVLQDSFLDFDSGSNIFVNKTAPELGHIALGTLVHIPNMGKDGILVYLGGAEGPSGWVPTNTTDGLILRDLGTVWVYDISNSRWYSQKTSGITPKGRISACAVVIPSQDMTSWNIFLHGGGSLGSSTGDVYGDTWVLSLPSFQWVVVDQGGDKKFEHTCHVIKGNKMLVIGGRDKLQDEAGNPAKNFSANGAGWTCLRQGIFSSMNLNTFEWENGLPLRNAAYEVNNRITVLIGGNATGGADKITPLNGWDDPGLGNIMFIQPPTNSTSSPKGTKGTKGTHSVPLGAIVGSVIGAIALVTLCFILYRVCNSSKDRTMLSPSELPTNPSVNQTTQLPPGFIWDPQTRQYYFPQELPSFREPAEVPAAIPSTELPVHK